MKEAYGELMGDQAVEHANADFWPSRTLFDLILMPDQIYPWPDWYSDCSIGSQTESL